MSEQPSRYVYEKPSLLTAAHIAAAHERDRCNNDIRDFVQQILAASPVIAAAARSRGSPEDATKAVVAALAETVRNYKRRAESFEWTL